jgi:transposase
MDIVERASGDVAALERRIRSEKQAKQRDRYRAVLLAIRGEMTASIQEKLGRSRGFVQRWAYAYRDGGLDAIQTGTPTGAPTKLTPQQEQLFKQRMLDGPTEADAGLCTLRGREAQRILEQQFGKPYSLSGVYKLMHRLGLSCLRPRPQHHKQDPQALEEWVERAPFLSGTSARRTRTSASKSGSRTKRGSDNKAR